MLVSKKHKALVLRTRNPEKIVKLIPKAKVFTHNGKEFVAVRHGVDETKILRNIGFDAPSPILYHYDWPGRFKPFDAQSETCAFMSLHNRAFCLNDLGTGKSISTLWSLDFLKKQGKVNKVLIISPLSTLERTWADELFQHFPHLTYQVLHGSRDKRLKLLNQDVDLYLINHDGIKVSGFVEAMAGRPDIDLIVVDEISQIARNATAQRFRTLFTIANKQHPRMVWGLTGTPTPNSPTDAWAQCRLVVPEKVTPYFSQFRSTVMKQVTQFKWAPHEHATEIVRQSMQPAIRFSRDEVVDLPECMYVERKVELTESQRKAYKDMMNKLRAEAEVGEVVALNDAIKAQKLIQICSGVAYGAEGVEVLFDAKPRMEAVREICEESTAKVIVFVPYVAVIPVLEAYLRDHGFNAASIHGGTSKHARDEIFTAFQHSCDLRVLIAQPASMSHGLTLTAANMIVWYAPVTSNDVFQQANGRITRPGQKNKQFIVMIEGSQLERQYYQRLKDKQKVQGLLLDVIQSERKNLTPEYT